MNVEYELEKARKRVAWLEAVKNMDIGDIYEWNDGDRHIIWVLIDVDLEGQLKGITLYDKDGKQSLPAHLVKWSGSVVDDQHRIIDIIEATEIIELLNKTECD